MNRAQTAASLALWKSREARYRREWQRLKRKNASTASGSKRVDAFKAYSNAHTMRVRRTIELRKFVPVHITEKSANKLIAREGLIPYAYLDSQHYPTAWVGHLIELKRRNLTAADFRKWGSKQNPAPRDKVIKFFREVDLLPYEKVVFDANKKRIKNGHPSLEPEQLGAAVSLTFNIGTGGFMSSTVWRRIVGGANARSVADAFMMWDNPPEIIGRRKTERDQYLAGG